MIRNVLTAILFLITVNCFAQQDYFVLIQADNNQPFYVRINGKILSSSDLGHLIIPQLKDTMNRIAIGFPKNQYPEQNFVITINKRDQSFQLKDLGDKGWALFNTKTMDLQMPVKADTVIRKQIDSVMSKKEDPFARLMAEVVNDTSVMHKNTVEEDEPVKNETVIEPKTTNADYKKDSLKTTSKNKPNETKPIQKGNAMVPVPAEIRGNNNKPVVANKVVAQKEIPSHTPKDAVVLEKNSSFIKKIGEQKNDSSYQMKFVYIPDKGAIDTVDVIIPITSENYLIAPKNDTDRNLSHEIASAEIGAQKSRDTIRTKIDSTVVISQKQNENFKKDTEHITENKASLPAVNKDCKSFASDYDIDKLRVKMLASDNDDDKLSVARSVFKIACFSVKQVRALSEVFKTDEGKYRFFDATYMHVSDKGNFIQLQDLLSDEYYVKRFKAMIR